MKKLEGKKTKRSEEEKRIDSELFDAAKLQLVEIERLKPSPRVDQQKQNSLAGVRESAVKYAEEMRNDMLALAAQSETTGEAYRRLAQVKILNEKEIFHSNLHFRIKLS